MTWLALYKIVFMSELLLAEALLVYRYPKRNGFAWRLPLALLLCYAAALFYPSRFNSTWFASSLMFIFLFAVTVGALMICFRVRFINILFCAVAAQTVQHVSYAAFSLVNVAFLDSNAFITNAYDNKETFSFDSIGGMMAIGFIVYAVVYFFIYLLSWIVLKKQLGKDGDLKFKSLTVMIFISLAMVADVLISDVFRYVIESSSSVKIIFEIVKILLCVSLLGLQMSMIKSSNTELEMQALSLLYEEQKKNYELRKETIDLINIKCHDFRHQIREIGSARGVDAAALQEMQDLISLYDGEIKTGNSAIDIILTEKSFLCRQKHIDFTCIVDGKQLGFIKDADLFALLGNILDNAVEAADKVTEIDKRCITLSVGKERGVLMIREDNYFTGVMEKNEDGLIDTAKLDKSNHGFGLKSIRDIATRNGGILHLNTNDDIFQLSIAFFDDVPEA